MYGSIFFEAYSSISIEESALFMVYEMAVSLLLPLVLREISGNKTPSGKVFHRFLKAEDNSRRLLAMSILLEIFTDALPPPLYETDDVASHPSSEARIPSILEVTSFSAVLGDAPGYE